MAKTTAAPATKSKRSGGRPPKFAEPSRPVTVTLPERTLDLLQQIDPDRARAITRTTDMVARQSGVGIAPVEVIETKTGVGLILVGFSRVLKRIPFLHMVQVGPGRYLLAIDPGHDHRALELALSDELDDLPDEEHSERTLLRQLLDHLRHLRKASRVSMAEILFVRLPA